jgi:hypothetical protein
MRIVLSLRVVVMGVFSGVTHIRLPFLPCYRYRDVPALPDAAHPLTSPCYPMAAKS